MKSINSLYKKFEENLTKLQRERIVLNQTIENDWAEIAEGRKVYNEESLMDYELNFMIKVKSDIDCCLGLLESLRDRCEHLVRIADVGDEWGNKALLSYIKIQDHMMFFEVYLNKFNAIENNAYAQEDNISSEVRNFKALYTDFVALVKARDMKGVFDDLDTCYINMFSLEDRIENESREINAIRKRIDGLLELKSQHELQIQQFERCKYKKADAIDYIYAHKDNAKTQKANVENCIEIIESYDNLYSTIKDYVKELIKWGKLNNIDYSAVQQKFSETERKMKSVDKLSKCIKLLKNQQHLRPFIRTINYSTQDYLSFNSCVSLSDKRYESTMADMDLVIDGYSKLDAECDILDQLIVNMLSGEEQKAIFNKQI